MNEFARVPPAVGVGDRHARVTATVAFDAIGHAAVSEADELNVVEFTVIPVPRERRRPDTSSSR